MAMSIIARHNISNFVSSIDIQNEIIQQRKDDKLMIE